MRFFSAFLLFSLSAAAQSFEDNLFSVEDDFSEDAFAFSDEMDDEIGLQSGKSLRRQLQVLVDPDAPFPELPESVCATCECRTGNSLAVVQDKARVFDARRTAAQSAIQFDIDRFMKQMADASVVRQLCTSAVAQEMTPECIGNLAKQIGLGPRKMNFRLSTRCSRRRELAELPENRAQLAASSLEAASSQRQLKEEASEQCQMNKDARIAARGQLNSDKRAWRKMRADLESSRFALRCQLAEIRDAAFQCRRQNRGRGPAVQQARNACTGASIIAENLIPVTAAPVPDP